MEKLLELKNISKTYNVGGAFLKSKGKVEALRGINFNVAEGETVAVIGESGSGKSTLALILIGLLDPDSGQVLFEGEDILAGYKKDIKLRSKIQIIFQDPYNTLNPRYRVYDTLAESLILHKVRRAQVKGEVIKILESVGLTSEFIYKYPHELSGGERQRIAIARALSLKPKLLIADEPTSNLDVSIQAQVLNLLLDIKKKENLTLIFITHDINIAAFISERAIVLYKGEIVEEGKKEDIFSNPKAEYSKSLLDASML